MKLQQLSVFLENKPGRLSVPCKALADEGINIITLSLADTQQFGILRLVVRDWEKTKGILQGCGCVVNVTAVVATEVQDRPGGLTDILALLENADVSIEYMYAFTLKREENAVLIFRFDDMDKGIAALQAGGVNVLEDVELYRRAEAR